VPEISCEHCAQAITKALQPQQGVQRVRVDVPAQKVHLEFDERAISLDKVKEILAEEEYPVEAVAAA
jgi:copper chaperone